MPALSDHPGGRGHRIITSPVQVPIYFVASLVILTLLGIHLSRNKRRNGSAGITQNLLSLRRKGSRKMQDFTSSAFPEKATGLNLQDGKSTDELVSHLPPTLQEASRDGSPRRLSNELLKQSSFQLPSSYRAPVSPASASHLLQDYHELGSFPNTTKSLLHPRPPSPTIALETKPMKIYTEIPYPSQSQSHYIGDQTQNKGQYMHNEMLFVPSPTEYTSFEALYSKNPPPIYHGPNPTSYTSIESDPVLEAHQTSYSLMDRNQDFVQDPTLPRRRSYTKTLSNGSEMSGEIIVSGINGEGTSGMVSGGTGMPGGQWRRHTRVFGGGVCKACEESENRRMTA